MASTPPSDDRFYKGNTLIRAFAISSIVMFLFTMWMVLDDFGREWKGYQREFLDIKKKKYEKQIEEAKAAVDQNKLKELQDGVAQTTKELEAKSKEVEKQEDELVKLKTQESIAVGKFQDEKAKWDVEKYHHEAEFGHKVAEEELGEGHHNEAKHEEKKHEGEAAAAPAPEGAATETANAAVPMAPAPVKSDILEKNPKARASFEKLEKAWTVVMDYKNKASAATQAKENKEKEIADINTAKMNAQKQLKAFTAEMDRLEGGKAASELNLTKLVRSSPIMDMANPVFKLQQIVLPTIRDDIFFAQTQKVDRCTTCHQAIDTPGFEDQPNPYKTHPKLDLMLGSRSPHPIDKIGCTVCHAGRGPASDFVRSAHTPRNEEQKKQWEQKYGWHEMHHVIEKMVPLQYTEGQCRVCHKQTELVPKAQKLTAGNQTFKAAGCYGCHRVEGWDHIRKPAPSLKSVKGKLSRDWIVKWVRNPQDFNEWARMPASFHQSNITTEEFHAYNEAEIHALTDYILNLSEDYKPNYNVALGNVEKGKQVFGTVGCLGCHQINDFPRFRGRWTQAPDLSTVGSKVTKDWLTSWLKNPRHYWEGTTMPSFRLSDSEISDLSAFLLSHKNEKFEQTAAGNADLEMQKKVLRLYYLRDPKLAPATEEKVARVIEELKPHEVSLKLGEKAMSRYGCFGCHEVKGWETTQGIGTELTEEGSKPVGKLDFGLVHLEHTNYDWFHKKLENSRIFDSGVVKEYLDLLRMPYFGMEKKDRDGIVGMMLGLTAQKIAAPAAKELKPHEAIAEQGSRVIHKYNCQGCHMVEGIYQPLVDGHPDFDSFEKEWKHKTEGRILASYADDETLGPPPLYTEAQRVRFDWAHSFIQNPSNKLRMKLNVRMPSFNMANEELNSIVGGWAAAGKIEYPVSPLKAPEMTAKQLADAKYMINKLGCMSCHVQGTVPTQAEMDTSTKGLAPDFLRSYGRLQRNWIVELLKDPGKMVPGTRMPGFWADGMSPVPEILNGDARAQMELIADYLLYLGAGRFSTKPVSFKAHKSQVKVASKR